MFITQNHPHHRANYELIVIALIFFNRHCAIFVSGMRNFSLQNLLNPSIICKSLQDMIFPVRL